jgi:hypothetical protein
MTDSPLSLPLPAHEFARRLSVPLERRPVGWRIDVTSAEVVTEARHTTLRLRVEVLPKAGLAVQRWELTFPLDAGDLGVGIPGTTLEGIIHSLVFVYRANIEEWWHTKDREPSTAACGRRLP